MDSFKTTIFLLLISLSKSGFAQVFDVQKDLTIIKGQLESIISENEKLKKKTTELEQNVVKITKENHGLKKKTFELEHKLDIMTQDNVNLKKRTVLLEQKLSHFTLRSNFNDRNRVYTFKSKNENIQMTPVDNHTEVRLVEENPDLSRNISISDRLKIKYMKLQTSDGAYKRKRLLSIPTTGPMVTTDIVAFSARVKDNIANLGQHQEIPFEMVESNFGQGFHAGTGTFSCPQSGVYAFFVTILAYPNKRVDVRIVKEGVPVAWAYSHGDSTTYGSGSTSVVIMQTTEGRQSLGPRGLSRRHRRYYT